LVTELRACGGVDIKALIRLGVLHACLVLIVPQLEHFHLEQLLVVLSRFINLDVKEGALI
jgi:hypothetical protein